MVDRKSLSVPVVFADRFFMAEKSLAEISSHGGYAWAEAKNALDLAAKLKARHRSGSLFPNTFPSMLLSWNGLPL